MNRNQVLLPILSTCLLSSALLIGGCAEQPYGYIFEPQQRDQVNVARQAADFIGSLFVHADMAAKLLEEAGLTDDYRSILPDGWVDITVRDTSGQPVGTQYHFYKNYLDKELSELQIDKNALPGAIRNPSEIRYNYYTTSSVQNYLTNRFYGSVDEMQLIDLKYADNLQNLKYLEGWYSITKTVPFEQEIEVQGPGGSANVTYDTYLPVGWSFHIEHYSVDSKDQTGKISIEGKFPIQDDENVIQECHVSGKITIASNGSGEGDIWLRGEPVAKLTFTSRSFGFKGKFALYSEDLKKNYLF